MTPLGFGLDKLTNSADLVCNNSMNDDRHIKTGYQTKSLEHFG